MGHLVRALPLALALLLPQWGCGIRGDDRPTQAVEDDGRSKGFADLGTLAGGDSNGEFGGVPDADAYVPTYLVLRLTPPLAAGTTVRQDRTLQRIVPAQRTVVDVDPGIKVAGQLKLADGWAATGTVRFIDRQTYYAGLDVLASATTGGKFSAGLQTDRYYDVVLLPAGNRGAPTLREAKQGRDLADAPYQLAKGETVSGEVVDDAGKPMPGATVVLRSGPLSIADKTGADGRFSLEVTKGPYDLAVSVAQWPEVTFKQVNVVGATSCKVAFAKLPRLPVTARVQTSKGDAMGAMGARFSLVGTLKGSAHLTLGTGAPLDGDGEIRAAGSIDRASGTTPISLPAGSYTALVEPPPGSKDGVSRVTGLTVAAANDELKLPLKPLRAVTGKVVAADPLDDLPPVTVTAVELAAPGRVLTQRLVRSAQDFSFDLNPDSDVDLFFDPDFDPANPRQRERVRLTPADLGALGEVAISKGCVFLGEIHGTDARPVPGVVVDMFHPPWSKDLPTGSVTTDAKGQFSVIVPTTACTK